MSRVVCVFLLWNDDSSCYETNDLVVKPMVMLWYRWCGDDTKMTLWGWWYRCCPISRSPTPMESHCHPMTCCEADDSVMKPMIMLWSRWQRYEADDHVIWSRWHCYETKDNVMKPMFMLWHRWWRYGAAPFPYPPTTHHPNLITLSCDDNVVNWWQWYETDDHVMKLMIMLWYRWSCCDHVVIPLIIYNAIKMIPSRGTPVPWAKWQVKSPWEWFFPTQVRALENTGPHRWLCFFGLSLGYLSISVSLIWNACVSGLTSKNVRHHIQKPCSKFWSKLMTQLMFLHMTDNCSVWLAKWLYVLLLHSSSCQ